MVVKPTFTDALTEAYVHAPSDKVLSHTLSFYYDGLVDINSQPTEIYIFGGYGETVRDSNDVPILSALLESDADINAGEVVSFVGMPFNIVLPDMTTDSLSKSTISIYGMDSTILQALESGASANTAIKVTYRVYIEGLELQGPQFDPPIKFNLVNVTFSSGILSGSITIDDIGNKRFPFRRYEIDVFRTLVN